MYPVKYYDNQIYNQRNMKHQYLPFWETKSFNNQKAWQTGTNYYQRPTWQHIWNIFSTLACCRMSNRDERPVTEIEINGINAECLWDTGASITAISWAQYKKLKSKPPLFKYNNYLTAANGQGINARGVATLDYKIGNYKFQHNTIILDNLQTNIILGIDLMNKHGFSLDLQNRKINQTRTKDTSLNDNWGKSPTTINLEPLQVTTLEIKTPGPVGQKFLVEGDWVLEGICETDIFGKAKILVVNRSFTPITITRGQNLCSLEKATFGYNNNNRPRGDIYEIKGTETKAFQKHIPQTDIDIALRQIPYTHKHKFEQLIREHSDIFSINPDDVGFCNAVKQKITLIDPNKVAARPPFRIPHNLTPIVEAYVTKLLKQGVIEKSTSPFSSPLMLVKKPGIMDPNKSLMEKYRVVHDYRLLNKNTVKMKYPLNHVFDLIDKVAGGKFFSVIDLSSGFWHQELERTSRDKTAFSVPSMGHFQYTRSAMGLANSAPYFQKLVDHIIAGVKNTYVYVDDVIVTSSSLEEHIATLDKVFKRFRAYGLKCRLAKMKLGATKVNYLGYEIDANSGIRPGELKTKAIRDYREPETITEVKSFLGLCSFYRKVIPFFSHLAKPLNQLTRKDSIWSKGPLPEEAKRAFDELKKKLMERPCLKPVDFKKDFYVTVDSSNTGTGAVLSQIHDGREHPCMYASKTHNDSEKNRPAFKLEADGIIFAMRTFRPIIQGGHTIIRTDHKPLATLDKTSTPILDRVYAELEEFSFEMQYLAGKHMTADGLSRQKLKHQDCLMCKGNIQNPNIEIMAEIKFEDVEYSYSKNMAIEKEKMAETRDEEKEKYSPCICPADMWICQCGASNRDRNPPSSIENMDELENSNQKLINISQEQIIEMQKQDHYIKALVCFIKYGLVPDNINLRKWVQEMAGITRIQNAIVGIWVDNKFKILTPLNLRETLMHMAHDHKLAGHQNSRKTSNRLEDWYWPNKNSDIVKYCTSCIVCAKNNPPPSYTKMALGKLPEVHRFNMRIHIDLIGPYPASGDLNYKYCLVISDAYSSFIKIVPIINKTTEEVCKALLNGWISQYSIPSHITLDAGSEFTSKLFKELSTTLGCELRYSSVAHPMSNGQVERANRNIITYIRKFIDNNHKEWSNLMNNVMFALNTSLHSDKFYTPYELVYGQKPTLNTNIIVPQMNYNEGEFAQLLDNHWKLQKEVQKYKEEAYIRHKQAYDKNIREKEFPLGAVVYLKAEQRGNMFRKFQPRWMGPLRVIQRKDQDNILLEHLITGKRYSAHCNRLKLGKLRQQVSRETDQKEVEREENREKEELEGEKEDIENQNNTETSIENPVGPNWNIVKQMQKNLEQNLEGPLTRSRRKQLEQKQMGGTWNRKM